MQMDHSKAIKRIGILTSGGDAPGMNAAIRAIVIAAQHYQIATIGFCAGYNGLIDDVSIPLNVSRVSDIIHKGGTILKSARCPAMTTTLGITQATTTLLKEKLDALIVIGGDGSFSGLLALKEQWSGQVIGIPGTIDNDIDGTDFTIGFSTAINTAIEAIDKIRDTAEAFERIFIVELMGKHSGHIAFNVGIACAAEQVISFENFPTAGNAENNQASKLHALVKEIKQAQANRHASYIIVLAENVWQGGASALAQQLQTLANIDCTACILGHIQRGGSPVSQDRILATKLGAYAVEQAITGQNNVMVGERNNQLVTIPIELSWQQQKPLDEYLLKIQRQLLNL